MLSNIPKSFDDKFSWAKLRKGEVGWGKNGPSKELEQNIELVFFSLIESFRRGNALLRKEF